MARVVFLLFLLLIPGLAAGQALLYLEADRTQAAPGETLQVAVVAAAEQVLTSASAFVSFDEELLELVPEQVGQDGTLVPFRPGPFLAGQVYENSTAGDGAGAGNGLAGFQLNYVVVQGAGADGQRSGASGRGVLAWFRLRAKGRPGGGEGRVWLDGAGQRWPVYTELGRPGVERRFQRPADPLVVEIPPGPSEVVPQDTTSTSARPDTASTQEVGQGRDISPPPVQQAGDFGLATPEPMEVAVGGESPGPFLEELVTGQGVDLASLGVVVEGDEFVYAWMRQGRLVVRGLQAGKGTVRVEVVDPEGRRAETSFAVAVRGPGYGPVFGELPDRSLRLGEQQLLPLGSFVSDPDTPLAELEWVVRASREVEARVVEAPEPGLQIRATAVGIGRIDLQVTDPEGNASAVSFDIKVIELESVESDTSRSGSGLEPASADTIPTIVMDRPRGRESAGWCTAYPNPFNTQVVFWYSVPAQVQVWLRIYDTQGRLVRTLVDQVQAAGRWTAQWDGHSSDGREAASGIYLFREDAGGEHWGGKLLLLR